MGLTSQTAKQDSRDVDDVRTKLLELAEANRTGELIDLVMELLVQARSENTALAARLHNALRMLYGRKSEQVDAAQLALALEALGEQVPESAVAAIAPPPTEPAAPGADETVAQPATPPAPPRGRGGRKRLPAHLPREPKEIRVPDAERVCAICGSTKKCMGHIVSEILEFVPAQLKVIEERREKLACVPCEGQISVAPSEKVMERGRPGPSLVSHLIVDKFQDAMPIYRQSQAFVRLDLPLSASTLGDWTRFGIEVLEPIALRIVELVLADFYVGADDTGLRVLDKRHPKGVKKGHLWAYVGMTIGLIAFDYTPTWAAADGPERFLASFRGFLHTDGYAGFEGALEVPEAERPHDLPAERRLGCGMHIRRKFEEAADAGDPRGAIALAYLKKLYRIEDACKAEKLDAAGRLERRTSESVPVVDELYKWLTELQPRLVPGTLLHGATRYAKNQESAWRLCFTDGRFEIDNGEVERQLRRAATGRKNYLFAGSDAGAKRIAIAYSVLASCQKNNVNPIAYLTDVIVKLQAGWPKARLDELLPHRWRPDLSQTAAPPADSVPPVAALD